MIDPTRRELRSQAGPHPPIDLEGLRRHMSEQGLADVFLEVVHAFLHDAPLRLAELEQALASGNGSAIQMASHTYKSAAAYLRAERLVHLLEESEAAGMKDELDRSTELLPLVQREHESVLTLLKLVVPEAPASDGPPSPGRSTQ